MPNYIKNIKTPDDGVNHGLIPSITPVADGSFGMKAGAALTEGAIVFKSTETGSSAVNKIYAITNTSKYIDPYWGLALVKKAASSGTVLSGDYLSLSGVYSYSSASAGIPYALKLTKNSSGYRVSTSTPQNIRTATDGYYIYLGVGETGTVNGATVKRIACDFSGHMFFRIVSGRIVEINGREIDVLHPSVPVSPESSGFVAGVAIAAGQILFRCKTDNKIYPINNTANYLDLDWGLGIAEVACAADATLSGNNILQQSSISHSSAVAGTDYGLSLVYDGTGYKISTGTLVDINNVTDGIMIYVGVGNGTEKIDCDFSNHTFLKIENSNISALNGRNLTINVPVSVDAKMPPAGESLNNSIVFKCASDGKLYAIESNNISTKPVDLDWGIALCKPNIGANVVPEKNKVVQKAEIDYAHTLLPNVSNPADGDDLYFYCGLGNNSEPELNVFSTGHIGNYDDVKEYAETNGKCVYMYVGQAIFNSTPNYVAPSSIIESAYIQDSSGTQQNSSYQDVHVFNVVEGAKYFVTASFSSGYGSYIANYYDINGIRIGKEYLQTNAELVDAELTLPRGTTVIKCNFRKADTACGMKMSLMSMALDTSNHTFFTITKTSRISEINGRGLQQNVPVSPESFGMTAGSAITAGDIVFRCKTDYKIYPISNTSNYLDLDWGLGIAKTSCAVNSVISGDDIVQQGAYSYQSATAGTIYYLPLSKDNTGYKIYSSTPSTMLDTSGNYIYLGHGESNGTVNIIACDFSNHMFFTFNHGRISHINGRELASSSGGSIAVPVSVDATPPPIGEDLKPNLVYKGIDGYLYQLNGTYIDQIAIDMNWGIAFYPGSAIYDPNTDVFTDPNDLLQKQEYANIANYLPSGASYKPGEPLFLVCGGSKSKATNDTYSKGIICSFDDVKTYAANATEPVTYLYVGLYNDDGYLALDVSNHMFYTFRHPDYRIMAINGVSIQQPTGPETYRNPVSGNSSMITTATALTNGCMVFCALYSNTSNYICKLKTGVNYYVEPEWGLGVYYGNGVNAGSRPSKDSIFQQCEWDGDGADLTTFEIGDALYALFDLNAWTIDDRLPPVVMNDGNDGGVIIQNRAGMITYAKNNEMPNITYCYIGVLVIVNGVRTIAVDLSAHQFITEDVSEYKITHINGKELSGSGNSGAATDLETIISGTAGAHGLFLNSLCCYDKDGEMSSFTKTGGSGTSKQSATDIKFPIGNQIYMFLGSTALASEADFTALSFAEQKDGVPLEYTGNLSNNFTAGHAVYLHVTIDQATGTFSPAASNLIVTSLTSGQYYIFLGWTNAAGKSIMFEEKNPLYYYTSSGGLVPYYDSVIGNIEDVLAAI